jgi:hypothetical protein
VEEDEEALLRPGNVGKEAPPLLGEALTLRIGASDAIYFAAGAAGLGLLLVAARAARLERKDALVLGLAVLIGVLTTVATAVFRSRLGHTLDRHAGFGDHLWIRRNALVPGALALLGWASIGLRLVARPETWARVGGTLLLLGLASQELARAGVHRPHDDRDWKAEAALIERALRLHPDDGELKKRADANNYPSRFRT